MNLAEIRRISRKKTKTTASNYPDSDLDADINLAYGKVFMILQEAEGYKNTGGDFEVIDFESSVGLSEQDLGFNGEFPIPKGDELENIPGAMSVIEAHINYGNGHKKAEIVNRSMLESSMFNDSGYYSKDKPKVFVFRDSIFVRPVNDAATITDGIKLVTIARQPKLIVDSDEPIFESNFHELIAYYVAYSYWEEYPEKFNAVTKKNGDELEAQAISTYQSRVPVVNRITAQKEVY
jgi:hypothetical protein